MHGNPQRSAPGFVGEGIHKQRQDSLGGEGNTCFRPECMKIRVFDQKHVFSSKMEKINKYEGERAQREKREEFRDGKNATMTKTYHDLYV